MTLHALLRTALGPVLGAALAAACARNKSTALAADGTIELTQVDVAPFVSGRVVRVGVEEGGAVRKGDTLVVLAQSALPADIEQRRARVSSAEARLRDLQAGARPAELQRAEAELRSVSAEADRAERDRARFEALVAAGTISRSQFDAAVAAARSAAARRDAASEALGLLREGARPAQVEAARAEVETAKGALAAGKATESDLVLIAPIDATVLGRYVEPGEIIGAGQVAVMLGDATRPWVRVYLAAAAVPYVKVGQSARVTVQGIGDRSAPARVATMATQAEFTPRVALTEKERADLLFGVKLDIQDTTGTFKAGLPATVVFDTTSAARRAP
ncbi:MAG TPA: HlyD family efflux transporter periplasmic adaptor subunit [Gemmatimonadaceae bacterium]|nr:HlyD family efflux transporter periplasmic adaptor subunit [Gemmatimonadaceae bacterium]